VATIEEERGVLLRRVILVALCLLGLSAFIPALSVPAGAVSPPYYAAYNSCASATSCSVTIPSTVYGDTVFVMVEYPYNTFGSLTDTFSTNLALKATQNVGPGYQSASTFVGTLSFSGQDQFTFTVTTSGTIEIQVVEKQGLFTDFVTSAKQSSGTGTSLSTGSDSFSGYTWFCVAALGAHSAATFTAGASYSLLGIVNATTGIAEYSSTVSSPTTFPATMSVSQAWADSGVCAARTHVSPANVWLLNFQSNPRSVFNINQYKGSYVAGTYTSSPQLNYSMTVPEVQLSLTGAQLVTAWVGTSYSVSLIPSLEPNPANITFLLAPPAQEYPYSVQVNDLSGFYGPGTEIEIYSPGIVYASNYLTSGNTVGVYMVPGGYSLKLIHGAHTYSSSISFPATQGATVSVNIFSYQATGTCGSGCTISYGASYASNQLTVTYVDSTGLTTSVTDSLYVQNSTLGSPFQVYTHTSSGTYGTFTDVISCNNDNCNGSIISQMYVLLTYNTHTAQFSIAGGGLGSQIPNFPAAFGGWNIAFPGVGLVNLFTLFLVVGAAGGMTAFDAKWGAVVLSIMLIGFAALGWFTGLNGALLTLLAAVAVMAFIAYLRQGR